MTAAVGAMPAIRIALLPCAVLAACAHGGGAPIANHDARGPSTGGTGHFSDVRLYTVREAKILTLGAIPGGDRGDGGIRHVALDGSAVIVDRNVLAEGDGVCCPSGAQRERWLWRGGEMVEDTAARRPMAP